MGQVTRNVPIDVEVHQSYVPKDRDIEETIERLRNLSEQAALEFVFSQLTVGITSCRIAKSRRCILGMDDTRPISQAEEALAIAEKFVWKFKLKHPEFDQMTALAERLRFEIDALKNRPSQQ